MMKRCFSTLCCLEATPEQAAQYAAQNGMEGVEIRVSDKGEALGCTAADAPRICRAFEAAQVTVVDLALSCHIITYNEAQIALGRQGMDFAAAVGAGAVRVFVGAHQGRFCDKIQNDTEGILKALRTLSAYGKERGVALWLETHSTYSSGKAMGELLRALGDDSVRVIWDVLHSLEYRETVAETVGYLGGSIAHIHLKDGRPAEDEDATQFIHTDLGQGTLPVREVVEALNSIGYSGFYSLEWESPWRAEIHDLYPDVNTLLTAYTRFLAEQPARMAGAMCPHEDIAQA